CRAGPGGPMVTARIHGAFWAAGVELSARPGLAELAQGRPGEGPWSATPAVFQVGLAEFAGGLPGLAQERFGPVGLVITYPSAADLLPVLARLGGGPPRGAHGHQAP